MMKRTIEFFLTSLVLFFLLLLAGEPSREMSILEFIGIKIIALIGMVVSGKLFVRLTKKNVLTDDSRKE